MKIKKAKIQATSTQSISQQSTSNSSGGGNNIPDLNLAYPQFRERYPLAKVVFEDPLFVAIDAGVKWRDPKVNRSWQKKLIQEGFERTLKQAWINNLNGEQSIIAYNTQDKRYELLASEEDIEAKHTSYTTFYPYEISTELKRIIIMYHLLLMDIGYFMGRNASRTILSLDSESQARSSVTQDNLERLQNELDLYDSSKIIVTPSGGKWYTIKSDTQTLLDIRYELLGAIAMATGVPIEILNKNEKNRSSSVFSNGDSPALIEYKNHIRILFEQYLYPIYMVFLQGAYEKQDPFALTEMDNLRLEEQRNKVISGKLDNLLKANGGTLPAKDKLIELLNLFDELY